jgi:hypothetical protein
MEQHHDAVDVHLRIQPGDGPVEGSIAVDGRFERLFGGWMDLVAALEALRTGTVDSAKRDEPGG